MNSFLIVIFVILFIIILVKPQKFGFFLGKDARLKAFFLMLLISIIDSQIEKGYFNVHAYFNIIGFSEKISED